MEAKMKAKSHQKQEKPFKEKPIDLGLLDSTKHMTKVKYYLYRYGIIRYQFLALVS
jgi:hypothetical protein